MAKIGYMLLAPGYYDAEADEKWMTDFGCTEIVKEPFARRVKRTAWDALTDRLSFGDILVVPKLGNALANIHQLVLFLEVCRVRNVRFISIHDRIDSIDELFPDTRMPQLLTALALLPKEAAALRREPRRTSVVTIPERKPTEAATRKLDRNKSIVEQYLAGKPIEEIFRASGFKSHSSVFRVLRDAGVSLDRNPVISVSQRKPLNRNERNAQVIQMYQDGASLNDIHRASGFRSRSSIFRILNAAGIDLNRGRTRGPHKKADDGNEQE